MQQIWQSIWLVFHSSITQDWISKKKTPEYKNKFRCFRSDLEILRDGSQRATQFLPPDKYAHNSIGYEICRD